MWCDDVGCYYDVNCNNVIVYVGVYVIVFCLYVVGCMCVLCV